MNTEIVIIGAGFSGVATAYHLIQQGYTDILILEQEKSAGTHASGRNAGMIRQVVSDEAIGELVKENARFIQDVPGFRQTGSLLLGSGETWKQLVQDAERASARGVAVERYSPGKAAQKVSLLNNVCFDGAIFSPTDGVVDIRKLLALFLAPAAAAGVMVMSSRVIDIQCAQGCVEGVVTGTKRVKTKIVVNAAGAWAGEVGEMAGAMPVPLCSYRRHLFVTAPLPRVNPGWPFVWDVASPVYFRPEGDGLLLSPCDTVLSPPCTPSTDPKAARLLERRLAPYPALQNLPIKTSWAGLRTKTPDGRFVIGWDPCLKGFFWVAGLGGHGVSGSWAIGRYAADLILHPEKKEDARLSPKRFLPS